MPGLPALARGRHAGRGRRRERVVPLSWWRRNVRERAPRTRDETAPDDCLVTFALTPDRARRPAVRAVATPSEGLVLAAAEDVVLGAALKAAEQAARAAGPRLPRKPAPVPRTVPAARQESTPDQVRAEIAALRAAVAVAERDDDERPDVEVVVVDGAVVDAVDVEGGVDEVAVAADDATPGPAADAATRAEAAEPVDALSAWEQEGLSVWEQDADGDPTEGTTPDPAPDRSATTAAAAATAAAAGTAAEEPAGGPEDATDEPVTGRKAPARTGSKGRGRGRTVRPARPAASDAQRAS